ncbi:hypothetical protein DNTS_016140 [Danionella cerebrum]|uniref:G-protein coupled receptors family 1 profile domain-containing protein n=1 Tax=Danionella cerebrum TaxID=2873325 RepID=A0A553Q8T9_9TELE|nr:hypothetical protein DNTS_016140 [Danionella translucida]
MASSNSSCRERTDVSGGSPSTSAVMFSVGVLGNVIALILLEIQRRKHPRSLFHVLVTSLVLTDLLGTFSVSPLVLTSYLTNASLLGMNENRLVCGHFAFAMTFLSMVTLGILLLMAVERWLSIGHPFCYEKTVRKGCGYGAVALVYLCGALFCAAPFLGFGKFVQYCPGTWCFIDMDPSESQHRAFNLIYASCLLSMIVCTVLCNASVIYHLSLMHRRLKAQRSSVRRLRGHRSISEEEEHLLLLGFMTIAFVICSLPLVIQIYRNTLNHQERHTNSVIPLLSLSANPIIDPWVFIILRSPVPRLIWEKICKSTKSNEKKQRVQSFHPVLLRTD